MEVSPSFESPDFGTRQNKLQSAIPFTSTKRRPIAQSSVKGPASTSCGYNLGFKTIMVELG